MNFQPYAPPPYGALPYLYEGQRDRRLIRKESNVLCWLLLAFMPLVYLFQQACISFVRISGAARYGTEEFNGFPPYLYYFVSAIPYLLALAVPAVFYLSIRRGNTGALLPFGVKKPFIAVLCVVAGFGLCLLANYPAQVVSSLEEYFGFSPEISYGPLSTDPVVMLLYVVNVAVVPALCEELLFRGVIMGSLRRFGDGFAIFGSALLFGLWHANFPQIVFAFLCGLVMAFAVVKTGSLWVSIFIHFLNNALSCGVDLYAGFVGEERAYQFYNILSFVLIAFALLAVVFLLLRSRSFLSLERGATALSFGGKLGALLGNVGGVIFLVYVVATSVMNLLGG